MAITTVASATASSGSTSSLACTKPTGTVDNDYMFALVQMNSNIYSNAAPSGWTSVAKNTSSGGFDTFEVFYKKAASEGANYTWGFAAANPAKISIVTYRGGISLSNPIEASSNTQYITSDTNLRAATVTTGAVNHALLFIGGIEQTTSRTFTKPTAPTTDWIEDFDGGDTTSHCWHNFNSMTWTGSGATGAVDSTISAASSNKHAFLIALNPDSTAYTITAAVGSYALTGIDALFKIALSITAAVGSFTLTGIAATFSLGKGISAAVGSFTLSGVDAGLTSARSMTAAVGSFTLTGISALFNVGITLSAAVGSFVLTGISAILRPSRIWSAGTKHSSTFTPKTKHTATFTPGTKHSSTWTPKSKN